MKIAFVIDSSNSQSNGLGGHYYSLLETVKQISGTHESFIINICNRPAKVLEDVEFKIYYIFHKGIGGRICFNLKRIIREEQPDILHAFDSCAYFWVRLVGQLLNKKICFTKCGGVNPIYSPYAHDLVLFSSENLIYYQSKRKFINSKLYLIPNRIKQFEDDNLRINKIHQLLDNYRNAFKLLRITRIVRNYRKSTLQFLTLIHRLNKDGIYCCGIIIGHIGDSSYFNELKEASSDNVFFFTEDEFTVGAKELISCADAVLGTGRSFMEAASKEKVLLCPTAKYSIPALINPENFSEAFYYNFSERIEFKDFNEEENYAAIRKLIQNKCDLQSLKKFSKSVFNDYFDSDKITVKYNDVYSRLSSKINGHYFDLILHYLSVLRQYYRSLP